MLTKRWQLMAALLAWGLVVLTGVSVIGPVLRWVGPAWHGWQYRSGMRSPYSTDCIGRAHDALKAAAAETPRHEATPEHLRFLLGQEQEVIHLGRTICLRYGFPRVMQELAYDWKGGGELGKEFWFAGGRLMGVCTWRAPYVWEEASGGASRPFIAPETVSSLLAQGVVVDSRALKKTWGEQTVK